MNSQKNLESLAEHFEFGKNWAAFSKHINQERINFAKQSLIKLLGTDFTGKSFLDIGCGSGLFSLSASLLNAKYILATDIDPNSIDTTEKTLSTLSNKKNFCCKAISVFDLKPEEQGTFDIVYSWGVLHHTGSMYKAITKAASMVKPGGKLALALYRKTTLCKVWTIEKKIYSKSPKMLQAILRYPFMLALLCGHVIKGRMPFKFIKDYKKQRGMSFMYDVHDWLGGYPYESISPEQMHQFAQQLGFQIEQEFVQPGGMGLFGSGCDEYILKCEKGVTNKI